MPARSSSFLPSAALLGGDRKGSFGALAVAAALVLSSLAAEAVAEDPELTSPEATTTPAGPEGQAASAPPETDEPAEDAPDPEEPADRRAARARGSDGVVAARLAPLSCTTVYAIQGTTPRNLWSVNTGTGAQSSVGTFSIPGTNDSNLNGLGVTSDGQRVYAVLPDATGTGRSIYLHHRPDGVSTNVGAGVAGAVTTHGAVNPVTGFYYYGGVTDGVLSVYGFDTTTNTSLGLVVRGSIPYGGNNGDWAFDRQGRLYVVAGNAGNNPVSVVDQAIPTTVQTTPVAATATRIAVSNAAAAVNGIAFGGDGHLYIASNATIYRVNPSSGATVSQAPLSSAGSVDLASCAVPSTIEVRKNFPSGRVAVLDQATVSVSGGGLASPVTATTAGTDHGVQDDPAETAGPVLVLGGTAYTISESGAGADPAAYSRAWSCESSGTVIASGTGATGTVTVPTGTSGQSVLCTFTNRPLRLDDTGDAPDSYGTLKTSDGPTHAAGAPHLGAFIDHETEAQPTAGADGDDGTGLDDEDGVVFNPALGYATPTLRTGTDPITLDPVVNHLSVSATAAGFASVWVDWNQDGDFLDAGERVAHARAVVPGANTVTFDHPANPEGIRTYVRVRYSTDPRGVDSPTGPAPDGEVEDYQVLVERLVVPAACAPVSEPFYAMTFTSTIERTGTGGAGTAARYPGVTVVDGRPVDMLIRWSSGNAINTTGFFNAGDDAAWNLNAGGAAAEIRFTFVEAGTTTPLDVNGVWTVNDMDASERAQIQKSALTGYAITPGSQVVVVDAAGYIDFRGTVSGSGAPESRFQVWFQHVSTFTSIWRGFAFSGFTIDGDGDVPLPQSCDDYGDAPDSYGTTSAADGPHHIASQALRMGADVEFDSDGQPTAAADGDDTNRNDDEDGVAGSIVTTHREPSAVEVEVTNTLPDPATLAGWLDLDRSGTFDDDERVAVPVPASSGAATYSLSFPGVTTTQDTYARFRLFRGSIVNPRPLGPGPVGEVEDYPVTVLTPRLGVTKTSDATSATRPGDTVRYTLTLANTGTGDYTTANPARLADDLTDLLDDAAYHGDAVATVDDVAVSPPTYTAPRLSWTGPLAAGRSVVLTYTATAQGGGDGRARNVAWAPGTADPGPTPDCAATSLPCDTETFRLPKLTIDKSVNRSQLPSVGQTVTYTVTVANAGPGDYTAAEPARFDDDLTEVLDDTQPLAQGDITATRGIATFDSPDLTWTGALPAGESATITYSLTYTAAGDRRLDNSACVPLAEAVEATDACRTVSVPGSGLRHDKSVDPVSGTPVTEGQVLTYTLVFTNVGGAAATVDTTDDLSEVLDDADLVGLPQAEAGLSATVVGESLVVAGEVPTGETRTVTYQVRVKDFADQGDHLVVNTLACEPGEPSGCAPETTRNPVRHLTLAKTSTATVDSRPGDTITYTVTATNVGAGAYSATDPAVVVDDLTGVLDDADRIDDATADRGAAPSYDRPRLTWAGALEPSETVTITYSVILRGGGDGRVDNVAWAPPGDPGPTPDCAATALPCATSGSVLPKLTLRKTSSDTELSAVGQQFTYTVTVRNPGPGDYTAAAPATFTDDLSDVLDDATLDVASITASHGSASFTDPDLSWTGALAAGESADVTYTLTYQASGDLVVDNSACVPRAEALDRDDDCRTVQTPGSGLRHAKTVDPSSGTPVVVGQLLTYTLVFENVGGVAAGVDTTDDLAGVLDDATLEEGPIAGDGLTATRSGDTIAVVGSVPAGETRTVTYRVRVKDFSDQGDHLLRNALACEPGDREPCPPRTTTNPVRHLRVAKTSNPVDAAPGDTVTYTVRLTNVGAGDYSATDPAHLVDDLTAVLDDATFDGVATASQGPGPTYDDPRVRWAGALAAGATVRVSYEVVLGGGGDGAVSNVVFVPGDPDFPGPTPDCATTTQPCATTLLDLPKLAVTKDADKAAVARAGETVTYTVVVTNTGPGDYTSSRPAVLDDDLSDVLDDAELDPASITGGATVAGTTMSWTGVLLAGQSHTITYTVTHRGTGDHDLDNTACVPVSEARSPADRCDTVRVQAPDLVHAKAVTPATGTAVQAGQTLTYTLTFTNDGAVPATVDTTDDLSDVLDDADLLGVPETGPGLTATVEGERLVIGGTVPPGQARTVTYQARVRDYAAQGDHVLGNVLACADGAPQACEPEATANPVRQLVLTKTSDATEESRPGDTVTYTVTARNVGTGDYTAGAPATVVDDLAAVLDDATYQDDAAADRGAAPTYAAPRITWSGALPAGEAVTLTYSVVLRGGGDGNVDNIAWTPDGEPGPTPDCATAGVPCAAHGYDLPRLVIDKSADSAALPATGETITYTVVVTNPGPGRYTEDHPAAFVDDLSDVVDDATAGPGGVTATRGEAVLGATGLTWSGVLDAGQSAAVTYTFTYRGTGNRSLDNAACLPTDQAQDPGAACDSVAVPGSGLVHRKSVDPATGTPVEVGQVLTYTLTFDNALGATAARVDARDDLSDVLDDATLLGTPSAGDGLSATLTGDALTVSGEVPAGSTRTVTYEVQVKAHADQGDHVLTNALACEPGEPTPCAPATTTNPVRHLALVKEQTSPAAPDTGDQVTYTLTVSNDGAGDWTGADPAAVVDDLTEVLDDATWDDNAVASDGAATFTHPELRWEGALVAGATVTITYSVTVANLGDHELTNTVTAPGCTLPACSPDPVVTTLPHVVPAKSSTPSDGTALQSGDEVTYTLSWTNDGTAAGVVDSTDDLGNVLDDAEITAGPTSSDPAVTASRTGDTLRVTGPVAAGGTVTVTYTVRIRSAGQHGDNRLVNVLTPDTPQVSCPQTGPCTPVDPPTTEHPVGELDDWKSVDPASGTTVQAGRRLTYTLHLANTGSAPVEVDRRDDLRAVLDDAEVVEGPTPSTPDLTVTGPEAGVLTLTGLVPVGAVATVTYTVEVLGNGRRGDDDLANFLLGPDEEPPAECTVADPDRPDCTLTYVSDVEVTKASDPASGGRIEVGDTVTYTLTFRNVGADDEAAAAPVDAIDDLSDVLDDATWLTGPTASVPDLDAARRGSDLRVTGSLLPGQEATVTYAVEVTGTGNGRVANVVALTGRDPVCADGSPTCTTHAVSAATAVPDPPDDGQDPADGFLPDTGLPFGWWLPGLALIALLAGAALLAARRRSPTREG